MRDLFDLRRRAREPSSEEAEAILTPFLAVITSPETTGPITGAALTSLSKILRVNLIDPSDAHASSAMQRVVEAVLNCQFEQSDVGGDEVVICKIVDCLHRAVDCSAGSKLPTATIRTSLETLLKVQERELAPCLCV